MTPLLQIALAGTEDCKNEFQLSSKKNLHAFALYSSQDHQPMRNLLYLPLIIILIVPSTTLMLTTSSSDDCL